MLDQLAGKENHGANRYDVPLYYSAEVARFVHLSTGRVHRWLKGYDYPYEARRVSQPPVMHDKEKDDSRSNYASFNDLVELLFIRHFLSYRITLQKLRRALKEAAQRLGTSHFVHQSFFTDGKNVCLKIKTKGNPILELLSGGQLAIKEVIVQLAHQIDFDDATKLARRWFPPEGNRLVVLDPLVSFGRPSIWGKGITTERIYDFYVAEGKQEKAVCDWLGLESKEVLAAATFETHLAA